MLKGKIADNADFWAGVMFLAFGAVAVFMARHYPMGSAMRMGPGYFPTYLGYLMMLMGLVIGLRGFLRGSEPIGTWAIRPLVVLGVGVIIFAFAMERLGFVPALAILIVAAAFASPEFKPLEVLLLAAVLIAGAVAIFIYGIGLPYRLFWWDY